MISSLLTFARAITAIAPRQIGVSLVLLLALSGMEGIGLLMLMPLLQLIGVDPEPSSMPNVVAYVADAFDSVGVVPTLGSVLALYLAIVAVQTVLQRWQVRIGAAVQEEVGSAIRLRLYQAISHAGWSFLASRRTSELAHTLSGEASRIGTAASQVIDIVVVTAVSVIYLGLAFHFSPIIAAIVLACAAALAWSVRGHLGEARETGARAAASRRRLHATIAEHLASLKTAKSYGLVERHAAGFRRLAQELRAFSLDAAAGETGLHQRLQLSLTALLAVIVYVSIDTLEMPAAQLLVLLFIFARLMPRLLLIYRRAHSLSAALPVYDAVTALERECLAASEPQGSGQTIPPLKNGIQMTGVTYHYDRGPRPAVADVTLSIPVGATTAIVGPSGAGKSTLADLLIGLMAPVAGDVLVDGQPLAADRLGAWRRKIGYVSQETFLFHDTIRANLTWVSPSATDDEIWDALGLAAANEFVEQLPAGLDTVVGERGVLLSGGERQRLSLARALLRRPEVLILDEATSSLDSVNELRIQGAIDSLHHQMTIVVITHRLATIRHADMIHVLDDGHLVESGTWDDMRANTRSRFRALCDAQGIVDPVDSWRVPVTGLRTPLAASVR